MYSGGTPNISNRSYYDGNIPFIKSGEINLNSTKECLSKLGLENSSAKLISSGDILIALYGATAGNIAISKINGAINQAVLCLNVDINKYYFYYYFQSKIDYWLSKYLQGGQPNLSAELLSKFHINYTSNNYEQEKISLFLKLLDNKIDVNERKIEALKKYRKGLLKIVCEQGHVCLLGEVLKEEIHKTKINNEYPIISSTSEGVFLQKDYFNHQVASDNNVGYKIIRKNQIVFSPQNLWLGNINLNDKYDVGCVSPSYKIYSFDTELIDPQFFIEYLKTPYMLYQYKLCSEQGASVVRRNLDLSSFLELKITLPNSEKQKIIGALKTHLDLLNRQLFLLKRVKSFLLQNMFI